jgi:hypothetical protein
VALDEETAEAVRVYRAAVRRLRRDARHVDQLGADLEDRLDTLLDEEPAQPKEAQPHGTYEGNGNGAIAHASGRTSSP